MFSSVGRRILINRWFCLLFFIHSLNKFIFGLFGLKLSNVLNNKVNFSVFFLLGIQFNIKYLIYQLLLVSYQIKYEFCIGQLLTDNTWKSYYLIRYFYISRIKIKWGHWIYDVNIIYSFKDIIKSFYFLSLQVTFFDVFFLIKIIFGSY